MIRPGSAALALALAATPLAHAPLHAADSRLVELRYNPGKVYRIEGRTKVQATIRFGEDEAIENVAIGDSSSWQVTPNKRANLLFVKPLEPHAATNMTVITNKRTYLFDLVANPRATPLYVMSFSYPDAPKPKADTPQLADQRTDAEKAATGDELAVLDPAELNFAWGREGDQALLPENIFDDGESTFLTWPKDKPIPAILVTDSKGTEGPVNYTVRGNTIVVNGVPHQIVLRSGGDKATMINNGPVRPRQAAQPGTALAARSENN